jgi:hypothetical protein
MITRPVLYAKAMQAGKYLVFGFDKPDCFARDGLAMTVTLRLLASSGSTTNRTECLWP